MAINVSFRFVAYIRMLDGEVRVKLEGDDPDFKPGQWRIDVTHICNTETEVVIRNLSGSDWRLLDRALIQGC